MELADRYSNLQKLDATVINELIDKIVIHSPEKINERKHVTIEIYLTYVSQTMTKTCSDQAGAVKIICG